MPHTRELSSVPAVTLTPPSPPGTSQGDEPGVDAGVQPRPQSGWASLHRGLCGLRLSSDLSSAWGGHSPKACPVAASIQGQVACSHGPLGLEAGQFGEVSQPQSSCGNSRGSRMTMCPLRLCPALLPWWARPPEPPHLISCLLGRPRLARPLLYSVAQRGLSGPGEGSRGHAASSPVLTGRLLSSSTSQPPSTSVSFLWVLLEKICVSSIMRQLGAITRIPPPPCSIPTPVLGDSGV